VGNAADAGSDADVGGVGGRRPRTTGFAPGSVTAAAVCVVVWVNGAGGTSPTGAADAVGVAGSVTAANVVGRSRRVTVSAAAASRSTAAAVSWSANNARRNSLVTDSNTANSARTSLRALTSRARRARCRQAAS
jgi:hypothetical protein